MPSWTQYITPRTIVIAVIIFSGIWNWASKVIKDSAKKRQAEQNERDRRENMLRTGKSETGAPVSVSRPDASGGQQLDPRRMLEEIAAKRQQQLEELRRRQLGQQAGSPVAPPRPAATPTSRPVPLPPVPARTMSPEQYNELKRRQAQLEANRVAQQGQQQRAAQMRTDDTARANQARQQAVARGQVQQKRPAPESASAQASVQRQREQLVQEQAVRDIKAAQTRADAQAAPVAEVAHSRGGSTTGVGSKQAAGITVMGATVKTRQDWRRIMAIQAILGPSAASRDMLNLPDPLRS